MATSSSNGALKFTEHVLNASGSEAPCSSNNSTYFLCFWTNLAIKRVTNTFLALSTSCAVGKRFIVFLVHVTEAGLSISLSKDKSMALVYIFSTDVCFGTDWLVETIK
jgi:hypothetical protein